MRSDPSEEEGLAGRPSKEEETADASSILSGDSPTTTTRVAAMQTNQPQARERARGS